MKNKRKFSKKKLTLNKFKVADIGNMSNKLNGGNFTSIFWCPEDTNGHGCTIETWDGCPGGGDPLDPGQSNQQNC